MRRVCNMSDEIIAFKGGRLWDGTGSEPVQDGVVLVRVHG